MPSREGSGRVVIYNNGGEIRYFLEQKENGWFSLTESERGGDEYWRVDAAALGVVELLLTAELGNSVRSRTQISGDVLIPFAFDELNANFTLRTIETREHGGETREHGGLEELAYKGKPCAIFGFGNGRFRRSVEASYCLSLSLPELQAAFLDPEGKPFTVKGY